MRKTKQKTFLIPPYFILHTADDTNLPFVKIINMLKGARAKSEQN
jgi:hypothetical protein